MPYNIEVLSIGENVDLRIAEVAQKLNAVQSEFRFDLPPEWIRHAGEVLVRDEYLSTEIWEFLKDYRLRAKGHRPYLIAVVTGKLRSERYSNLFGSHRAQEGMAVITLRDHQQYTDSYRPYLAYYFIRYALSFVCPDLKVHKETRDCFFDFKQNKRDLEKSLRSGAFCGRCNKRLDEAFNPSIRSAIGEMISAMKAEHSDSEETLHAGGLKGSTQVGIISIREDEFEAVLRCLGRGRPAAGKNRYYQYARVLTKTGREIGVAAARSPEQGQGPALAVAADMISDFAPSWILLVGIAGGFPDSEYTLGDVMLASRVHDFAVTAALEGGITETQQQGGAVHRDVEKLLTFLPALKKELGDWGSEEKLGVPRPSETIPPKPDKKFYGANDWKAKVHEALSAHFAPGMAQRNPIAKVAPMITANTLVKDTALARQWRASARHATAVEMELGGVYLAARYGGDGDTRVLAVRGISDIVGYKRRPEWTTYAGRSAAALAFALITSGRLT